MSENRDATINLPLVTAIVGVATIGGFMFGYDSGVIIGNGTLHLASRVGLLALVSANFYVIFFNVTWGPVMRVMLGEMFPNQIRGSGLAVSGAAQWSANFLVSMSFPVLAKFIGLPITYGFYTAGAFLSIVFVLKMVHETRGRELEDMVG